VRRDLPGRFEVNQILIGRIERIASSWIESEDGNKPTADFVREIRLDLRQYLIVCPPGGFAHRRAEEFKSLRIEGAASGSLFHGLLKLEDRFVESFKPLAFEELTGAHMPSVVSASLYGGRIVS
jgi:hypothetical protein